MRGLFFLFCLLFLNQAQAGFLQYTESQVITQKMEGIPKSDPMYKYVGQMAAKPIRSKLQYYIHDGKIAIYTNGDPTSITDYNKQIITNLNPKAKTYFETTLAEVVENFNKLSKAADVNIKSQYKRIKGERTISGHKCLMYKSENQTSYNRLASKAESDMVSCIWMDPPKEWIAYQLHALKAYKPHIYKIAARVKGKYTPDLGFPLYTQSQYKMNSQVQAAKFTPVTQTTIEISEISESAFDANKFSVPKGYKKVKAPKLN